MLDEYEQKIWNDSVRELNSKVVKDISLDPIKVKTSYFLQGVLELRLAIDQNYHSGLLSDEQLEIALGFCSNLIDTRRANEVVRALEYTGSQETNDLNIILVLPNESDDSTV